MEQLAAQTANLGAQGWMIARDGFTPDALSYAGEAGDFDFVGRGLGADCAVGEVVLVRQRMALAKPLSR